jgi:voltage-gated potassium channel Kch
MKFARKFIVPGLGFFLVILGATFLYQYFEGWVFLDSLYFVVATVTTIGYGDFVPLTSLGKIFTIFFSFFGIAAAFYIISLVIHFISHEHVHALRKEVQKNGTKRAR